MNILLICPFLLIINICTYIIIDADKTEVWVPKKRASRRDHEATLYLLDLRATEKYKKLFNNKKHPKQYLWATIAADMAEAGFNVGEGKEAGEKCRQKFANLQRTYISYLRKVDTTGTGFVERPQYNVQMDRILGDKQSYATAFNRHSG